MNHFISLSDVAHVNTTVDLAASLKRDPYAFETLGKRKTIGLLFFNRKAARRVHLPARPGGQLMRTHPLPRCSEAVMVAP